MNKYEQVKEILQKVSNYKDTIKWNAIRSARLGRDGYMVLATTLCDKELEILRESVLLLKEVKKVKYIWDNKLADLDKKMLYLYAIKNISSEEIATKYGFSLRTTHRRVETAINRFLIYFNSKQNCYC